MAKNETAQPSPSDPLKTVADALDRAYKSAKGGTAEATAAAGRALPAASRFLSRFVYTTSYTLSYGIVFPAVMIARSIPQNNSVMQGFADGGRAAREKVEGLTHRRKARAALPLAAAPAKGRTKKRKTSG
jgi:hypothetical protein